VGLVGVWTGFLDGMDFVHDSIPSLGFPCSCKVCIPSLDFCAAFCVALNCSTSSLACVSSLAGIQVQLASMYPFQWTRYCVLLRFLVGWDWRIFSIL